MKVLQYVWIDCLSHSGRLLEAEVWIRIRRDQRRMPAVPAGTITSAATASNNSVCSFIHCPCGL